MKKLRKKLGRAEADMPVATPAFLVGAGLAVIAYFSGDLPIEGALAYLGAGGPAIGFIRNQAGKGVRRH